jgi:hypothetical protein
MDEFDMSTENLANLFVTKFYNVVANAENIHHIQNEITNRLNTMSNPIVRNVTLPTYRTLLSEVTRQLDTLRDNHDSFNNIIDDLQQFYQDGINNNLWDEMGPPPPPPELRRN